jgi:polysaccharide export outer membrane protein
MSGVETGAKRRRLAWVAAIAAFSFALSAHGQEKPAAAPPPVAGVVLQAPLVAGDEIVITVKGENDFSGPATVAPDGAVTLKHLGALKAAGLTPEALARAIAKGLVDQQFLRTPQVSVAIANLQTVDVQGEVARPGPVRFQAGMDALAAAEAAGGRTPFADAARIGLVREGAPEQVYGLSQPALLQPGDTVRFLRSAVTVAGEVGRPGETPFTPGMTLGQAVAAAGGFTPKAKRNRVYITHPGLEGERVYRLKPDLPLRAGDAVRIEARVF